MYHLIFLYDNLQIYPTHCIHISYLILVFI